MGVNYVLELKLLLGQAGVVFQRSASCYGKGGHAKLAEMLKMACVTTVLSISYFGRIV